MIHFQKEYVGKHSEEELLLLNDTVLIPSSSEPSTPIHETQQAQSELSPPSEQKVPPYLWLKVHLLELS